MNLWKQLRLEDSSDDDSDAEKKENEGRIRSDGIPVTSCQEHFGSGLISDNDDTGRGLRGDSNARLPHSAGGSIKAPSTMDESRSRGDGAAVVGSAPVGSQDSVL